MKPFTYQAAATRVVFGDGALQHLGRELDALGMRRALLLSTPGQAQAAQRLAQQVGERAAGVLAGAVMHVPRASAEAARDEAQRLQADGLVALGGGSTTGLAKAVALELPLPIIAIPSTYAGSELTSIWGLTDSGVKKTGRDVRVQPRTVIYDPSLTLGLPLATSVTSALNAIAHAAEALYAHDGNPVTSLMAEEGIRAFATSLDRIVANPRDLEARSDALYGAWLCGTVLGAVAMGLHHKLCHTLGGSFNLPHAETHAVLLPHALAYNAAHAPQAMQRLARALDVPGDAPRALQQLAQRLGAPTSLRELGMSVEGLDRAADLAVQTPYPNPRPLERSALRSLLQRAYDGAPATAEST